MTASKPPAAQVEMAEKAAAMAAVKQNKQQANDGTSRLLSKREVLARVGVSYPTLWLWMRQGKFPRSRALGGNKSVWIESEVERWIAGLPVRRLKGDDDKDEAA